MTGSYRRMQTSISRCWHYLALSNCLKQPDSLLRLMDMKPSRTDSYFATDYHFHHFLPQVFVNHRHYFEQESRGFGEAAFHSMWYVLFEKFKPENALEIGVYRGQTITLW